MVDSAVRIGLLAAGARTNEQRAACEWAAERYRTEWVEIESVTASALDGYDLLWWHRDAPLGEFEAVETLSSALSTYLDGGGGLLLGLRAMSAVEALGIDDVGPDAVGVDSVAGPTGLLWKRVHEGHPAVAAFDRLRIPIADHGAIPYARYKGILPVTGEILAATVEAGHDRPRKMSVVSWHPGAGQVLGVGAPLSFAHHVDGEIRHARDRFAEGLIETLAGDTDPRYARPKSGVDLERFRRVLRDDADRPQYHITPPANWLNDPNGLIEYGGRYHVFYQYNPAGPSHHTIHWGHAVSDDLVHWEDRPVALTPSPDGPDRDGCWSGCAVDDDGTPTVLYTGGRGREQRPCLATSDDPDLREWEKHNGNPVIEEPPDDLALLETEHWETEFRDHCVWRADGRWHQIIGTGVADVGGAALLYTSDDLRDWAYEGPLLVGDWTESGTVWECPELLDFGDKQLLHVSNYEDVISFLGTVEDGRFSVESQGLLDHGDYYAPQSLRDGDRVLTWGWLTEARDLEAQWNAGWSGTLSLPRVLELDDGDLRQRPAAELRELRETRYVSDEHMTVTDGERRQVPASGRTLELEATVALDDADAAVLSVFESPDREEVTEIRYTREGRLLVDRARASHDHRATTDAQSMDVPPYNEPLSLRVFLDGSVVEIFANERHCLTSRVYPTREDSTGISVTAEGGRASVDGLSAWELGSAWPAAERRGRSLSARTD